MSYESAVLVSLTLTLSAAGSFVLFLCALAAWVGPSRPALRPGQCLDLSRWRGRDRFLPAESQRFAGRLPPPDALTRWHCRVLLQFNYRDNERDAVTTFPPVGKSGVCSGLLELAADYKRPEL